MTGKPNVMGQLVEHISDCEIPGAYCWTSQGDRPRTGLLYICPCGCGVLGGLAIRTIEDSHPSWSWDGNVEKPTQQIVAEVIL